VGETAVLLCVSPVNTNEKRFAQPIQPASLPTPSSPPELLLFVGGFDDGRNDLPVQAPR